MQYLKLILIVLSFKLSAEIIKDDNFIIQTNKYTFEEACSFLTKRESPLIDIKSVHELSCMGKTVNVSSFCEHKEMMNDHYSRAKVSASEKKVLCLSSKRVVLKYKCEKKKDRYCQKSEEGCFYFKEQLAKKLTLAHHSLHEGILNCYFDQKTGENVLVDEKDIL